MRPPLWIDFVLVVMSSLVAGALYAMPSVLLSVRKTITGQEARRMLLTFILFSYSLCGMVVLWIIGRIAYVTTETRLVLRWFLVAQLVAYSVAAVLSIWLLIVVLRPAFKDSVAEWLEPGDKS